MKAGADRACGPRPGEDRASGGGFSARWCAILPGKLSAHVGAGILECASTQPMEFRHYDRLLDRELATIDAHLQRPRRYGHWLGRRHTRAARQVHALPIDLNELTDRTENAVKFVGDPYAVRLFRLAAERLGLAPWKAEIHFELMLFFMGVMT